MKRNKKNWIPRILMILLCCPLLTGCTLALPETEGSVREPDAFIGLWLALGYSGQAYEAGDEFPLKDFTDEMEDELLYLSSGIQQDTAGSYRTLKCGNGVMDVKSHVSVTDGEESVTMEGTVYATKNAAGAFAPYALYQRADGSCYVGESCTGMRSDFCAGSSMSMKEERSRTATDSSGSVREETACFTVNVEFIDQLQRARALVLDENYDALETVPFTADADVEIEFPEEGALLLIEETWLDSGGQEYVTRTLYQRGENETEYHYLKWEGENGIAIPSTVTITGLGK